MKFSDSGWTLADLMKKRLQQYNLSDTTMDREIVNLYMRQAGIPDPSKRVGTRMQLYNLFQNNPNLLQDYLEKDAYRRQLYQRNKTHWY